MKPVQNKRLAGCFLTIAALTGLLVQGSTETVTGQARGNTTLFAQWAIAETGTLVLDSEKELNRLTSLVPDVHICIFEAKKIRQTMGEILQLMASDLSPAVTFITGPSRTSDIELTLAIGVHGPRELYVIIIENDIDKASTDSIASGKSSK